MSVRSSLRAAVRTVILDAQMARIGALPGWYTWTRYRGRMQHHLRRRVTEATVRLRVNGVYVSQVVMPWHLGALCGIFLDNEYDARDRLGELAPRRVLDLGANVGMATAYLHALYPEAKFLCVEPDSRNHSLLRRTIDVNNIDARIIPSAVASRSGSMLLRVGDDSTLSVLETSPLYEPNTSVQVNVTTVPTVLADASWEYVDLVKIDIEGCEEELLSDNNHWLEQVGAIIMEIHANTAAERIQSFIQPFGFKLERLDKASDPIYLARKA